MLLLVNIAIFFSVKGDNKDIVKLNNKPISEKFPENQTSSTVLLIRFHAHSLIAQGFSLDVTNYFNDQRKEFISTDSSSSVSAPENHYNILMLTFRIMPVCPVTGYFFSKVYTYINLLKILTNIDC